jgi:hypothetical protein
MSSQGAAGPDKIGMVISWLVYYRAVDPDYIGMTLEFGIYSELICLLINRP